MLMMLRPKTVFEKVSERMMNAFGHNCCPVRFESVETFRRRLRRTQTSARPDLSSTRALLPRNSLTWPSVWCAATNLIGRSFAVRYHGILIRNAGASHLSRASLGWQMKQNVVSLARSTTNRGDRASACDEVACVKTALGFNKKKPHPEFGVRVRERCVV